MSEQKSAIVTIIGYISLALVTILSNGFYWEYKKIVMEKEKIDLEKEKLDIDRIRIKQEKEMSEVTLQKQRIDQGLFLLEKDRHHIELEKLELEKQRNRIENEKHSIEKIREATGLREKKSQLLAKIIDLTEEYLKIINSRDALIKDRGTGDQLTEIENKIGRLRFRLENYKSEHKSIEYNLARIENRAPENINLNFIPPPMPTGLRISIE